MSQQTAKDIGFRAGIRCQPQVLKNQAQPFAKLQRRVRTALLTAEGDSSCNGIQHSRETRQQTAFSNTGMTFNRNEATPGNRETQILQNRPPSTVDREVINSKLVSRLNHRSFILPASTRAL